MKDRYKTRFAAKWPEDVANRGFAAVPVCFVTCAGDLGLKPLDVLILCNVVARCWEDGDQAFFGVEYLATNVGRKKSAVIESTTRLAKMGFLKKTQRYNVTNLYSLEPAQEKLNEHQKHCRRKARNPEVHVQKTNPLDNQESGDYIEPVLTRNTYLESNINSHSSYKGTVDQTFNKGKCMKNPNGSEHVWREFEIEKTKGGEVFTRYYFTCADCGLQFHKDRERPWNAEYPYFNPSPKVVKL